MMTLHPDESSSSFFSMVLRMKYLTRWGLMRNANRESLAEHTLEVAILSHALAVIGNRRFQRGVDPARAALLGLYHDVGEILTGDLPTPVKYHDEKITAAYKQIEKEAGRTLFSLLPADLKEEYLPLFEPQPGDEYLWRLVKGADKLSALIKCVEEEKSGNTEFRQARLTIEKAAAAMELPELDVFLAEFFSSFAKTLDEQ